MNYFELKSRQIVEMANEGFTKEEIVEDLFRGIENRYDSVRQRCFSSDFRQKLGRKLALNKRNANKENN